MTWDPDRNGHYFNRFIDNCVNSNHFKRDSEECSNFIKESVDLLSTCINPKYHDNQIKKFDSTGIAIGINISKHN